MQFWKDNERDWERERGEKEQIQWPSLVFTSSAKPLAIFLGCHSNDATIFIFRSYSLFRNNSCFSILLTLVFSDHDDLHTWAFLTKNNCLRENWVWKPVHGENSLICYGLPKSLMTLVKIEGPRRSTDVKGSLVTVINIGMIDFISLKCTKL